MNSRAVTLATAAFVLMLLMGCAYDPMTGSGILAGSAFAWLAGAELALLLQEVRPSVGANSPDAWASTQTTVTAFAAVAWTLHFPSDTLAIEQLCPLLAALGVAALRAAASPGTTTRVTAGLLFGTFLACTWVQFGLWLALACLGMRRGRAHLARQALAMAERLASRVAECLPWYLAALYAALFGIAGLTAAGFAVGFFSFDTYLSGFRIADDALGLLPHQLVLAKQATWSSVPAPCSASALSSLDGMSSLFLGGAEAGALSERFARASTLGPTLLVFVRAADGAEDVMGMEAIRAMERLVASIEPEISLPLPLAAVHETGASTHGLMSPAALFTAPEGRLARWLEVRCDQDGCDTTAPLPGGVKLHVTAVEVTALFTAALDGATGSDATGDAGPTPALSEWLVSKCRPQGAGRFSCGPLSCCPCDAPPTMGCVPLPLCREEAAELVFADTWAPRAAPSAANASSAAPLSRADAGYAAAARDAVLHCTRAAEEAFRALLGGSVGAGGRERVRVLAAAARMRYTCADDAAWPCDGAAYANAVDTSGFMDFDVLIKQARAPHAHARFPTRPPRAAHPRLPAWPTSFYRRRCTPSTCGSLAA